MENKLETPRPSLSRRARWKKSFFPYLLMSPTMLLILIFLIVPLAFAFYCSLYRCDYMQFSKFMGLQNYADVLTDPDILASIGRSFFVSMLSLVLALALGVLLALWIHMLTKGAAYVLQLLVLIPWVTSMIVAAMLWKWIFQDDTGLLNYLLSLFGVENVGFLTDKRIAIYTLIFVMTWRVIGYVMIQVLAGLKAIPVEYEEAAQIDGASKWYLIFCLVPRICLPTIACASLLIFIGAWNEYTVSSVLVNSQSLYPIQVSIYNYIGYFGREWGPLTAAATIAVIPILIVFTILGRMLISGLTAGAVKE